MAEMAVVEQGQTESRQGPGQEVAGQTGSAPARTLHVLFVMRSLTGYLRFFKSPVELMLERGHRVRLLVERATHGSVEQLWLERMLEHPNFACDIVDHLGDPPWHRWRTALRRGMEYVRVLHLGHSTTTVHYRKRFGHAPPGIRKLVGRPLIRTRRGLGALYRLLAVVDRVFPTPRPAADYVESLRPDVVALCDYAHVGSLHSVYAKIAKELGIPVAICVATWDNLSSRQRMHVVPHALIVWNERQLHEAVDIHGIPAERVTLTGAQSFDDWFTWQPRPRQEFLAGVGLDPERPVILWLGGALYKADRTEAEYAAAWVAALRAADDPVLREAGVLLRPHPRRLKEWLAIDVSGLGNAVVWPSESLTFPVDPELKSDLFDSIYHSGVVVGLNTSAMIEAAIVGRPILTVLDSEFHDSQLGTFHFSYLLESAGGAVRAANSIEEQFAELSEILAGRDPEAPERARRFVAEFVRPHGIEKPATPIFVETLEQLADLGVRSEHDPIWIRLLRGLLVLSHGGYGRTVRGSRAFWSGVRSDGRAIRRFYRREIRKRYRRLRRRVTVHGAKRRLRRLRKRAQRVRALLNLRSRAHRVRRFFLVKVRAGIRVRYERIRNRIEGPVLAPPSRRGTTPASGRHGPTPSADVICHCRSVEYRTVQRAIRRGARTVADLQRRTTACTRCFGCRSELEGMLRLHLGDAFHHEQTVTLPPGFAETQAPRTMFMPVLAGYRGADVDTRVIAFNWEGPKQPVRFRADLLRPDGQRVKVWNQNVAYGCAAVLDVGREEVGALLPEGVGTIKLVLDTDEIGSLRPYFQFLTPTCVTSTHEKKGPRDPGYRSDRSYHWIFPIGVGRRDEEAYFFCTNTQMEPMTGELVWTANDGTTATAPMPTLEFNQSACVPLHEHFEQIGTGEIGGSVWLSPATHMVAGFMIRHDPARELWRVQHL